MDRNDRPAVGVFVLRGMPEPNSFQRHAVVGSYGTLPPFVQHAGLLKEGQIVTGEQKLPITHMGPPCEASASQNCHLVGQVDLNNEQIEAIDDWLASVSTQYRDTTVLPFQQYVIIPHMQWVLSEEGRQIRQRFSCVGYVLEAYRDAEVDLVEAADLPLVDRKLLAQAYPDLQRIAETPKLSQRYGFPGFDELGVPGDGPWPVMLVGYLFHSLSQCQNGRERPGAFVPQTAQYAEYPLPYQTGLTEP